MFHRLTHNHFRPGKMAKLESLNFDNLALCALPLDPEKENFTRQVKGACFSKTKPEPVSNPETVAVSLSALRLLDLDDKESERPEFAEYFSGSKILPGCESAAHCYCGHQFGYFSGQLGDGAAMYLGEVVNSAGERWEIQLKGAGPTPYSRQSDGRKVLRSSIREFLCSEAMHHLGIPTTRAGSCVTSDTKIVRDIFYTGNPIRERATLVLRIAPTFIRIGSFEIFKPLDAMSGRTGPSDRRQDILEQMLEYVIKTFFAEICEQHKDSAQDRYLAFYREVVKLTAHLVAEWQCVGFCHGVLNTDNISIVGLTIDYGPYGFMDAYNPDHICNTSDDGGRYTYVKQPMICRWNMEKLAEAISLALPVDVSKAEVGLYDEEYEKYYMDKMRKKLGLLNKELPEDKALVEAFLDTMQQTQADFTNCFRCLSRLPLPGCHDNKDADDAVMSYLLSQCGTVEEMKKSFSPRMDGRELQMMKMLMQMNPQLLEQLGGGQRRLLKELERMEKAKEIKNLTQDEKMKTDEATWEIWLSLYRDRLTKETEELDGANALRDFTQRRVEIMNANNPKFILRNYIAQNAIEAAEKGDFTEVQRVLKLLENPYSDSVDLGSLASKRADQVECSASTDEDAGTSVAVGNSSKAGAGQIMSCAGVAYDSRPPQWASELRVT